MEPFKNNISPELVVCIAGHLEQHLPQFNREWFEGSILKELESLELKARSQWIADHIHKVLPVDHVDRYKIIRAMLHPAKNTIAGQQSNEDGILGWGMMPLGMVVGQYGQAAFEESLLLLKEMTKRFSSEFDVRYFLLIDQERALNLMGTWVADPNYHVRRLVSEGTRPRLPWAMQLPRLMADPSPMLPLLEALRDDDHEYVRRSVANHLNDIAKDHPDLVAGLAKRWMKSADDSRKKLVRHACRTLIKQGHPEALEAFGLYPPEIKLMKLEIKTENVTFDTDLVFAVEIISTSKTAQDLIIDYALHLVKANGKRAGKIFKWKRITLEAGKTLSLQKFHGIKPISTRRYYEGVQGVSLRINGKDFGFGEFTLTI